jgi:hypothetical protein
VADALAGIESQRYQSAAQQALQALGGASSTAGGLPQFPGGQLGGIMKALATLKGIREGGGQGGGGLVAGFPMAGGYGFGGGSEAFREATPFPMPVEPAL